MDSLIAYELAHCHAMAKWKYHLELVVDNGVSIAAQAFDAGKFCKHSVYNRSINENKRKYYE